MTKITEFDELESMDRDDILYGVRPMEDPDPDFDFHVTGHTLIAFIEDELTIDTYVARATFPSELLVTCSDEGTPITTSNGKYTFHMVYSLTLTDVRATLTTATTTGTFEIDVKQNGVSIFSLKPTIDATETNSNDSVGGLVISEPEIVDGDIIRIDVTDDADGTATGLKVWLIGTRSV